MKEKRIVFRIDDVCETMNHNNFKRMKLIFDKYGIKPLLGVVPINKDVSLNIDKKDPGFMDMMMDCRNNGWMIAMHGTYHVYTSHAKGIVTKRPKSEFAGLEPEKQLELIKTGKEKMVSDGIDTDIFFAPGHSYDRNTLIALKKYGFKYISDGRSFGKYERFNLQFIPVRHFNYIVKPHKGITTNCLHLNTLSDQAFVQIENYIKSYRDYIVPYSEVFNADNECLIKALFEEKTMVYYEYSIHPILRQIKRIVFRQSR